MLVRDCCQTVVKSICNMDNYCSNLNYNCNIIWLLVRWYSAVGLYSGRWEVLYFICTEAIKILVLTFSRFWYNVKLRLSDVWLFECPTFRQTLQLPFSG
jgi:hypothetical protein